MRGKRGQFIILGALIIVISLLFVMAAYSFATVYRVKLVKEDFRATVFKISSDLRMALEASTAEASKRWSYGYVDYEKYGNDLLMRWVKAIVEEYSGLGLRLNLTFPVDFELRKLIYEGYASANVSMSLNLTRHGFYGWRDLMSVEDHLWVNSSSVRRVGDQVMFNFTLLKEGGEPVAGLTTGHITIYMREEQEFRRYIDPSNITLTYLGDGEYFVNISTGTYDMILYNLNVSKLIVKDYPDNYFKNSSDINTNKTAVLNRINYIIDQVEADNWAEAYNLTYDLRVRLDPSEPGSWVVEDADTYTALMIIDETLGYMLPTFELTVYDERGIVTMCFVSFQGAIDAIGPIVKEVIISPATAQKSVDTVVTLKALIDDSETGGSEIKGAEFFVNEEHTYGTGYQMTALDGSFDEVEEWAVNSSIDISGWDVGDYVFLVHGKDEHGNWGKVAMVILRIRDRLPPEIGDAVFYLNQTLYPEPYTEENGTLGAAELSVNVTGVSDLGRGDSTITAIECRLYNGTYTTGWTLLTPSDGAYDEPSEDARGDIAITDLSPGLYTLQIRATDEYGNQARLNYGVRITRDFIGPRITCGVLYNSTYEGDMVETYGEPVGVNVTAEDVGNAGYYVAAVRLLLKNQVTGGETGWVYLNASDGGFDEREEDATGLISVDGLPPGTYTVVVQAIDSGGNVGENYTALTVVRLTDILGPEIVSLDAEVDKAVKSLNVTALVSDEGRGGSDITIAQCRLYNGTYTTGWLDMTAVDGSYDSPREWVYAVIDVSTLSPGVYTVEVGAMDSMGNISENRTAEVVIDFEPPEIYMVEYVYNPASKTLSVEANVTDVGHGGSNITIARCRLYNDTYDSGWVDMTAVKGAYNVSSEVRANGTIDLTGLTSGLYNLEVEGYDSEWNRANITITNIQLDLESPDILNFEALYNYTREELNITALISDVDKGGSNVTGAWCRVLNVMGSPVIDWTEMLAKDGAYDSPEEWVEFVASTVGWPSGIYMIEINATDSAGNTAHNTTAVLIGGWLTGWQYRKSHTIIGSSAGSVTDYQVKIIVHYGPGADSGADVYLNGKCQPDFDDIRFTASDGETQLSYWIEEKVDGDHAVVWIKIPIIPANPDTATIYIYYGNSTAASESNGDATFEFFDDFEGANINGLKWTDVQNAWLSNGAFRGDGGDRRTWARTIRTFSPSFVVEFSIRPERVGDFDSGVRIGNLYFLSDTLSYGAPPVISTWWAYPWGSHGPDLSYHHYRITVSSYQQLFEDLTSGGSTSASYTYNVGYLYLIGDSDWGGIDTFYDWIFVRRYINPEPTHGVWGPEESILS